MPSLILALSLSLSSAAACQISCSLSSSSPFSLSKFSSLCHLIVLQRPSSSVPAPCFDSFYISFLTCPSLPSFSESFQASQFSSLYYPTEKCLALVLITVAVSHLPPSLFSTGHQPQSLSLSSPNLSVSFYISLNQRKQRAVLSLHFMFVLLQNAHGGDKRCENNKL